MKTYNCIIVFNQNKDKVLFCKRTKDPYKGKYNFVGGKVEAGEGSIKAAYRELQEETGISKYDIRLFHLMDITYYYQDFILELYVGQLQSEVELQKEVNYLMWLPLTEDFADADRFAGDQNIAHIINVAKKYPVAEFLAKKSIDNTLKCIGVDGCKGGWIAVVLHDGKLSFEKHESMKLIVESHPEFDEFLVDMVIGFPSSDLHIRPDSDARKLLPGRTSTIFAVPSRQAVYADTEEEQVEENKKALGKGLAKQTMAIIPKMRELDEFLQEEASYKNVIKESHPEVCFARLNGSVVMSKKVHFEGMMERVRILKKYLPELEGNVILSKARELKCNPDDIVDAICLAVTANLYSQGYGETIPAKPMLDDTGLIMQMIVPKEEVLL